MGRAKISSGASFPSQSTVKRVLLWVALFYLFCIVFFSSGRSRSTDNNLLFFLTGPDSPLKSWPVSITAGVIPRRFHSHNDYEQNIPLYKALSYGASSVEADVWLVNDELLVGHTKSDLSAEKTLSSLYLQPLISLIQTANTDQDQPGGRLRGIFDTAPYLPLQFLIDLKTDGPSTFAKLYSELSPLRSAGYLSTLSANMSTIEPSAITIVGTGNTPLESVQALGKAIATPRDIFMDAPLAALANDETAVYNKTVSPLASASFSDTIGPSWMIPSIGRSRVRRLVNAAHAKGIQTRFWNTPMVPLWARNTIWQMLLDEGSDWLNVDDLAAARDF